MRFSWPDHLQAARAIEATSDSERGTALGLMGMALLLLAEDLLEQSEADKHHSLLGVDQGHVREQP
jgi:hypothetical protein